MVADIDNDGNVNYKEFIAMIFKGVSKKQTYFSGHSLPQELWEVLTVRRSDQEENNNRRKSVCEAKFAKEFCYASFEAS